MVTHESPPYREIRVKLPAWLVLALRQMVEDANAEQRPDPPWTVSRLLERWLLQAMTTDDIDSLARRSPEFRRAAEEWLRCLFRKPKGRTR